MKVESFKSFNLTENINYKIHYHTEKNENSTSPVAIHKKFKLQIITRYFLPFFIHIFNSPVMINESKEKWKPHF